MTTNRFWSAYSTFEDELRRRFHTHGIYRSLHEFSNAGFQHYLLQVGCIAQEFVKWYETAKLGLTNEAAKEVVRTILRDEIPQGGSTHQDDRLYDLRLMGVSRDEVVNVRPSAGTRQTIRRLYSLVGVPQKDSDLRIMVTLRIAGEVLVAEQYGHIVEEMRSRFGIRPEESRFYAPHYTHDLKGGSQHEESAGHTDKFDEVLASMITDKRTLKVAKDHALAAFHARSMIHNQFLDGHKALKVLAKMTAMVACAVMLTIGFGVAKKASVEYKRGAWASFLSELHPSARSFYLECDRWLLERVERHGNTADFQKVGTSAACPEVW